MKVRIRKALPHETPSYNSKLSNFLVKAANGMEVQQEQQSQSQEADSAQIIDYIKSLFEGGEYFENVVAKFSRDYGIDTDQASDFVKYVQDNYVEDPLLFGDDDDVKEDEVVDIEEQPVEEPVAYDYNLNEDGVASGDLGDGLDLTEDDQMKFGGSKSKTIKHFKKLLRAAAGTAVEEQDNETSSQPNIRGTIDNPSDPYNNNTNFIGAINNQVKDNFYTKQAEKMYEQQANGQFGFGGNRRIRRANKAFFGTKTAPVGVDTDYKFGLLGNLKEGTIKWDPEMITNMMQQFGTNQAYQGFGYDPGYGGGRWNSSYNTGWKKTKVAGTTRLEKVIKTINSAADPTKVNNVELNNDPVKTSNTEWMGENAWDVPETWTPEFLAYRKSIDPADFPETNKPWAPLTDPRGTVYNYNNLEGLNYETGLPLRDADGRLMLNKDGEKYEKLAGPSYYFAGLEQSSPYSYLLEDEYTKANNIKKFTDYTPEQQKQLQDFDQRSLLVRDKQGNDYSSLNYDAPDYGEQVLDPAREAIMPHYDAINKQREFQKRFSPNTIPDVPSVWSPYTEPIEEDGGFVDPSQMQPGVLQKFFSGGYDDITQEDIDFTNSKNTTGSYAYGGGIKKFGPGGPNQVDPNYRDAGGRNYQDYIDWQGEDAIDTDVSGNKMSRQAPLSWADWKAEQDAEKNPNGTTDRHTTRNTTTYNNQGPNQGWYDPRQAAFAIPGRGQGRDGSFRNMMSQFMPVTNDMTWYNQTAGPLGAIKEGYAPTQLKYSKQRKTDGTWAERKLGFNKDRFVDVTYNKLGAKDNAGVGVYAPGQGVNANMKSGTSTVPGSNNAPGASTVPKAEGNGSFRDRRLDRRVDRWDKRANAGMSEEDYVDTPGSSTEPIPESSYRPGSTSNTNDVDIPMEKMSDDEKRRTDLQSQRPSQPFSSQQYLAKDYGDIGSELGPDFEKFMATNPSKEDIDKQVGWSLGDRNRAIDNNQKYLIDQEQRDINKQSLQNRNIGLAYGGYVPNDYMAYGGYLPEAQFGKVGPFMTNDTDCTDQQKRDPQSPCYDANFAIPAFARPGASIQEMMGIDNINCSEEDKLDPESDCYVDPDPNSITKRFKVNKAKTVNFGAIGAGANLAGNATARVKEVLNNNKLENTDKSKIYTSMGREDMKDTEFRGTTTQMGWDPNAGYESTGRMTTGFGKKGGSVNNEGDITYMSSKQIKEFLKNGGQLEFQ